MHGHTNIKFVSGAEDSGLQRRCALSIGDSYQHFEGSLFSKGWGATSPKDQSIQYNVPKRPIDTAQRPQKTNRYSATSPKDQSIRRNVPKRPVDTVQRLQKTNRYGATSQKDQSIRRNVPKRPIDTVQRPQTTNLLWVYFALYKNCYEGE